MKLMSYVLLAAMMSPMAANAQLIVEVSWSASANSTASSPGSVQVYRAPGTCAANPVTGTTYTEITPDAPAAGPYDDTSVTASDTYCYYVTATVPGYNTPSVPSTTAQVTVSVTSGPAAPSGLTATVINTNSTAAVKK